MTELLNIILITSIWCLGITIVTQEEMGLHFIRVWAEERKSKIWYPLIICTWCLSSLHSIVGYAFAFGIGVINDFSWSLVFMYPLVVAGASLISGVVWSVYVLIEIRTKYYSNIEKLSYWDVKDRRTRHQKTNHF